MRIDEFEKFVNEEKLCCYESLVSDNENIVKEQPFLVMGKQGYFKEIKKAEENLIRCGFS